MELLVRAGRSAPHALMMMIPEAFGPEYHISLDKQAFYEYHGSILDRWDGPAAMLFTDGRLVGGTLDRNGLRPSRYVVTTEGLVVLASEVGVIEFPPEQIERKGRLAAGPHVPGRYRRRPHRRGQRNQGQGRPAEALSPLAGEPHRASRPLPAGRRPARRSIATSWRNVCGRSATRGKTCQMIVGPMAANGQEPVGSMGTDTPLAVLSDQPKLLFSYFKQLFAQVTNPPIDPLREGLVMSLLAFTGKARNLLDETPEHCRQLQLPHPILTNDDMQRLRTVKRNDFKVAVLPAVVRLQRRGAGKEPGRGPGRIGGSRRAGDSGRGVAADHQRPRHFAPARRHSQPAGHFGPAPRPLGAPAAERSRHRRGKRRAARSDALLPAAGLRRQRHQSLHGL